MKKALFTLILAASMLIAYAQPGPKARQRVEAAKIAFITHRLDLSTSEAQQFWPIYNNYQKEMEALIRQRAMDKKNGNVSDGDDGLEFESSRLEIQKRYSQQFFKVLPKPKALAVFKAEREFRQKLIKELGDRRNKNMAVQNN